MESVDEVNQTISGTSSDGARNGSTATEVQVSTDMEAIVPETPTKRKNVHQDVTTPAKKIKSEPNTPKNRATNTSGDTPRNVSIICPCSNFKRM
jgi:hypothetical protein